jgi:hypothetical protein
MLAIRQAIKSDGPYDIFCQNLHILSESEERTPSSPGFSLLLDGLQQAIGQLMQS